MMLSQSRVYGHATYFNFGWLGFEFAPADGTNTAAEIIPLGKARGSSAIMLVSYGSMRKRDDGRDWHIAAFRRCAAIWSHLE